MAEAPSPWNTRKTNNHCRLGASAAPCWLPSTGGPWRWQGRRRGSRCSARQRPRPTAGLPCTQRGCLGQRMTSGCLQPSRQARGSAGVGVRAARQGAVSHCKPVSRYRCHCRPTCATRPFKRTWTGWRRCGWMWSAACSTRQAAVMAAGHRAERAPPAAPPAAPVIGGAAACRPACMLTCRPVDSGVARCALPLSHSHSHSQTRAQA